MWRYTLPFTHTTPPTPLPSQHIYLPHTHTLHEPFTHIHFYLTHTHTQVVGVFLIGLVVAARTLAYFTYVPILVGIAICGTLLVAVAILGLIGTIKHHQVILFFVS